MELFYNLGPQHTGSTHLGDFHEMVHTDGPEERQTGSEGIDVNAGSHSRTKVFQSVGQGISQLDVGSGTRFLHVVSRDRDGVEFRHLLRSVFKDVGNNLHGEGRRINISVAHHEFLQNIVLDGSGHFFQFGPLFQSRIDVERHDGKYRPVHGHGYRHLVQRNTIEKHLHVFQRADRYTRLTHIAHYTRMIRVITTVSRKVEGHRQTFLSGSQVTTIEGVGFFCGRESGILTDGPRTEGVHHGVRATKIRRNTRCIVQVFHALQVFLCIYRLHLNLFRCFPVGGDAILFLPFHAVLRMETSKYIDLCKILSHSVQFKIRVCGCIRVKFPARCSVHG
ncbi:uncharacterized protein BN800_01406 [Bacteroides sp. CAG:875]|nr:uncharacterized protein BN800_01406 [Bacteroides sp. CAG:875]